MKVSYNWLKDYVDIKIPAGKLAELLTMAGLAVDSIEKKGDDSILEIEVTSNRPDWLSYIGVAREVAAITDKKLRIPASRRAGLNPPYGLEKKRGREHKAEGAVSVKVENKKLCPRYTARVIRNVKVGESPDWLKKKIEAIGLRPVNNIVDITNFCLFETGEPMHAFDLDKLKGRTIIVRNASKGEKIVAIDGTERSLDESMLVIADSSRAVAIAGVMGSLATEVNTLTKNILLEAAYFDPISVRRTSRKLALPTESSYRFERKVDIENIVCASNRATQLILEIAGGEAGEFIDIGKASYGKKIVKIRLERLNKIIGANIPADKAKNILSSLGLKVKQSSKNLIKLEIPNFRCDLQNEIDLVEEVARVYGYDNIPEEIPPVVEKGSRLSVGPLVADKIREVLASLGLYEIITYSLLSKKLLNSAKISDANIIEIKNPLSAEQEVMQPTLIVGMLNSMRWNLNRKTKDLQLFELGKIYSKQSASAFVENRHLAIGITGQIYDGWVSESRPVNFFDLKGIVETLFSELGINNLSLKDMHCEIFSPLASASIEVNGDSLGVIGQVESGVLSNFDIKDDMYIAQIDGEKLIKHASLEKCFKEPPRYPSIVRDISIIIDKTISNAQILSSIKETAGVILKDVQLIDRYLGGQIPEDKTSLTYRLEYQDLKRTLEDKDVQEVHSRIVRTLESNLGARLR